MQVVDESRLRVAYYADDATGASDAMAQFQAAGLRTLLSFQVPTAGHLRELAREYDVIGFCGVARALSTEQIPAEIIPAMEASSSLRPLVFLYKVCSTFDSSPQRGSIGKAIEVLANVFNVSTVLVAPAQPVFGRYTAFGNHFAQDGERVFRLDRHPTMSTHPSTPMHEADLVKELLTQGVEHVDLLDVVALRSGRNQVAARDALTAVVADSITDRDLDRVAQIALSVGGGTTSVVIGSGGIAAAIGRALAPDTRPVSHADLRPTRQVLVVSGSASARSRAQIDYVTRLGWEAVPLDLPDLLETPAETRSVAAAAVSTGLAAGKNVVLHTTMSRPTHSEGMSMVVGMFFGEIVARALRASLATRVVIAGGDTSSFAVRNLPADGLELVSTALTVGGPLCRVLSHDSRIDGAEIVLKGGQVGSVDLLERVLTGRRITP